MFSKEGENLDDDDVASFSKSQANCFHTMKDKEETEESCAITLAYRFDGDGVHVSAINTAARHCDTHHA